MYCDGLIPSVINYTCPNGCSNGACNPAPPLCTSFTYSAWGTCQSNGQQTRTVIASSPNGCTGGSPVLTQSCTSASTCNDSDVTPQYPDGKNYYVKGTTSTLTSQQNDSCNNNYVQENYCLSNNIASTSYLCPNGCSDGKCVGSSIINVNYSIYDNRTKFAFVPLYYPYGVQIYNNSFFRECVVLYSDYLALHFDCPNIPVGNYFVNAYVYGYNNVTYSYRFLSNVTISTGLDPLCTSSYWISSLGPCLANSTQVKTWTKTGSCVGGVTHPNTESVTCTYVGPVTCVDSDADASHPGGLNYEKRGFAKRGTALEEDYCLSDANPSIKTLRESICATYGTDFVEYSCPELCYTGACVSSDSPDLKGYFSFYDDSVGNVKSIILNVSLSSDSQDIVSIPLLYGRENLFGGVGSLNRELAFSIGSNLNYNIGEDFVFSESSSVGLHPTHYLFATLNNQNQVSILDKPSGSLLCSGLSLGYNCSIGRNSRITITSIQSPVIRFRTYNGALFNRISDKAGNYIFLDEFNPLPDASTSSILLNVRNMNGMPISLYEFSWLGNLPKIRCVNGACNSVPPTKTVQLGEWANRSEFIQINATHKVKVTRIDNSSSSVPSDDVVEFTLHTLDGVAVNPGASYPSIITSEGVGRVVIEGILYTLEYRGASTIPPEARQARLSLFPQTVSVTISGGSGYYSVPVSFIDGNLSKWVSASNGAGISVFRNGNYQGSTYLFGKWSTDFSPALSSSEGIYLRTNGPVTFTGLPIKETLNLSLNEGYNLIAEPRCTNNFSYKASEVLAELFGRGIICNVITEPSSTNNNAKWYSTNQSYLPSPSGIKEDFILQKNRAYWITCNIGAGKQVIWTPSCKTPEYKLSCGIVNEYRTARHLGDCKPSNCPDKSYVGCVRSGFARVQEICRTVSSIRETACSRSPACPVGTSSLANAVSPCFDN
jgi:hypothetical protein